jgi:hypothetical protein
MTRPEFVVHTAQALADVIKWAGEKVGVTLPSNYCVGRLGVRDEVICADAVEYVVSHVYEAPDRIRPCVDLVVSELLRDGSVLVRFNVAGYEAAPFQQNWSGREGPYVFCLATTLGREVAG